MKKQPATKSYFFDKGYRDIAKVMKMTWTKAFKPIKNELGRLGKLFSTNFIMAIFSMICDIIVFIPITIIIVLFNSIFSIVFFLSFISLACVIYILYSFAYLADGIFCLFKGIVSHCPNCQTRFIRPSYKCPKCGVIHTELRPSIYGIMQRKCQCGQKLPTTFFNGRQKLQAICAKCGTPIKDGGQHIELVIPVVGGKSAGKTCFITTAISGIEQSAPKHGLVFEYSSSAQGDYYEENKERLKQGLLPDKTFDERMMYYQFYLTPKGTKIRNLISFCDVAGETFESNSKLGEQIGYKYANAFIMVIDPLSVTQYREEVSRQIDLRGYSISVKPMDEILSALIGILENMHCISSKTMIKTDVVVVFTKCDIPGIEGKIGESAVLQYRKQHKSTQFDAQNRVCEKFLLDYSEGNFLNSLKSKFKSVQFFTCSALGHKADGTRFTSNGVEVPALWIIDKVSTSINLQNLWGIKI